MIILIKNKQKLKKITLYTEHPVIGPGTVDGTSSAALRPNAMALRRRADTPETKSTATGSSMQTAFQISLTVLSFLAFGGYVISLVTQNMRRPLQSFGMTAPQPLKTVVVNQNRRPGLMQRPMTGTTMTSVSFGRSERSRRSTATARKRN